MADKSDSDLNFINEYIYEAKNFRNDGWVQKHYIDKLEKIYNKIKNSGLISDKKKYDIDKDK